MENRLEQRMYFFVPYNISDIQKGIQAGHAALQYANLYGHMKEYISFLQYDKTWIILNGGTTRDNEYNGTIGTLNEIRVSLLNNRIPHSAFNEPDLNYALTALCFLADERVWNKEKYPDWQTYENSIGFGFYMEARTYNEWVEWIGGDKNVFLGELLQGKRLA